MKVKWFTLIELLIAVTISALIMTSVLIFTWDMIRSSLKSEKILKNQNNSAIFENKLSEVLNNISSGSIIGSWSSFGNYETWIILYNKWAQNLLIYIWTKTFTWYCDSLWQSTSATWTIRKLIIKELVWANSHKSSISWDYYIDSNKNSIYYTWWSIIIWNGVAWNTIWNYWTWTQLSNPSAIFETATYLYVADSWNNRILSYNKTSGTINLVAEFSDWINNPSDIYYENWELFIANTWNGNILKIKDSIWDWTKLVAKFKQTALSPFDKIEFKFDWISTVNWPNSTWDFTFVWWINKYGEDFILTWGTLSYIFSWANSLNNSTYEIDINNITPRPTVSWNYWVNINFYSWAILVKSINSIYYIKWDSTVANRNWNIIEIMTWWILYPNNITWTGSWDNSVTNWNWAINNNWLNEFISEFPVENFNYKINWNLLNIKYNYYKNYDCITDKHTLKERNYIKYLK